MGFSIASIYQYIYIIFVAILTFASIKRYESTTSKPSTTAGELALVFAMIFFIGLRPISKYFVDMYWYNLFLELMRGETFVFTWDTDNKIFDNLEKWWGCNALSAKMFFLFIANIYFLCAYIGIKRLFSNHALIAYIVFLGAFSTFSYSTNGIKAGAAASIFIMALGYWDKLWVCLPLMLVSLGFHHSMILPIMAFILTNFFKNPKLYYYGWLVCFLLALFHVTYFQKLFGNLADDQGSIYLLATQKDVDMYLGFRPDFVLYSAMPVIIGYTYEMRWKIPLSKACTSIIHFYLTTNAIWMLCMFASYTNRIAYLSWFVYPIVIIYPFLDAYNKDEKRFVKLRKTTLYHLYFTLFMNFIYYGLLSLGT